MIVFIWVIAMLMLIPDLVAIEVKQLFPELTILLTSCEANWVYRSLVGILVRDWSLNTGRGATKWEEEHEVLPL